MRNERIEVDRDCYITKKDFAPCMESFRETAINVTTKHPNDGGFINFMLAIDTSQQCCENWGTALVWLDSSITPFDSIYVSHIVISDKDTDSVIDKELYLDSGDYLLATVYGEDDKPICCGYVYNSHNGYYAHTVFMNQNYETKLEYL